MGLALWPLGVSAGGARDTSASSNEVCAGTAGRPVAMALREFLFPHCAPQLFGERDLCHDLVFHALTALTARWPHRCLHPVTSMSHTAAPCARWCRGMAARCTPSPSSGTAASQRRVTSAAQGACGTCVPASLS